MWYLACCHYRCNTAVLLLISMCFLSGCGPGTRLNYTIPDNYSGFLVIEYECAGGYAATQQGVQVHITFDEAGVACISERYEEIYPTGVSSVASSQTQSGQRVDFVGGGPREDGGYAVVGVSVMIDNSIVGRKRTVFEILWAGEQQELIQLITRGEYVNAEADFFEQSLGIQRDGRPRITPTPRT